MCDWGTTTPLVVLIQPDLSYTGKARFAIKPIDACIAPIVRRLNAAGIFTTNSCCGHGKADALILLADGTCLTLAKVDALFAKERAPFKGAKVQPGRMTPDDTRKYVTPGRVKQETGKKWKDRPQVIFIVRGRPNDSETENGSDRDCGAGAQQEPVDHADIPGNGIAQGDVRGQVENIL